MCINCYKDHGSPIVVNDAVRHAADLVDRIYDTTACGDNAHIVTDDWNIQDENIQFVIDSVRDGVDPKESDQLVMSAMQAMLPLTIQERATALGLACGFAEAR